MNSINYLFFHELELCIKSCRQFIQQNLLSSNIEITLDQWQCLDVIHNGKAKNQKKIAQILGKDAASITRIIVLLLKKGYLTKQAGNSENKRQIPVITPLGEAVICSAGSVIDKSTARITDGIPEKRLVKLKKTLKQASRNCK